MRLRSKMIFQWLCVALFWTTVSCQVASTPKDQYPKIGSNFMMTCENTLETGITWNKESTYVTDCLGSIDFCTPPNAGYTATSDVSNNKFFLELSSVSYTSCGTYTCIDSTDSGNIQSDSIQLKVSSPASDCGFETNISNDSTVLVTTNCVYPLDNYKVNWTLIYQGVEEDIPSSKETTPIVAASDCGNTCGTESVSKITASHTPDLDSAGRAVQFKVIIELPGCTSPLTWTSTKTYTIKQEVTTTTPHPECSDCCCCDNKKTRDGACGAVLAVCICVMAVLVFCCYKGFSSENLQGKIILIVAIIFFLVALTGFILSAICLSKECCSGSEGTNCCQAKNCFKADTIAGFALAGISVLGTILIVILVFQNVEEPGSAKKKTEAENEKEELRDR